MKDLSTSNFSFDKFAHEEELREFLIEEALTKYEKLFGQKEHYYANNVVYFDSIPEGNLKTTNNTPSPTVTESNNDFSQTNTQVQGVDESDLIKTDGKYIYTVDNGTTVNIVDVNDFNQPKAISQVEVKGAYIEGLYLHDNGLMTVISSGSTSNINSGFVNSLVSFPYYPSNPVVNITILDISSPKEGVRVLETTEIEGSLIETRVLNERVYVVTNDSFGLESPLLLDENGEVVNPPHLFYKTNLGETPLVSLESTAGVTETSDVAVNNQLIAPPIIWEPKSTIYTYETKEQYLNRIETQVLELSLPDYTVRNQEGDIDSSGLLTKATEIYKPLAEKFSENLKTISVIDLSDDQIGISYSTALPKEDYSGDTIYMNTESLYLASPEWDSQENSQGTEILKFDLHQDGKVDLAAEGEVSGSLLNQFSLDEEEENLRVATTTTDFHTTNGTTTTNNVYVLEQNGQQLDVIGQTEDLAVGERIYSTRFDGNVGYVVTFRQVDPLFAIDLSDPENPEVLSELKVPGFSEYLQIIDVSGEQHLLGIGRDADPITGRAGTLKLSLFDLEDLTKLTEVDNYLFPEDGNVDSPALWEHHALSYFPEWQVLALPFQNYNYHSASNIQGLRLFKLDAEYGITHLEDISHDRAIERSLRVGNHLVTFSDTQLTFHEFNNDQFTLTGKVDLSETTYDDDYWILKDSFGEITEDQSNFEPLTINIKAPAPNPKIVSGSPNNDLFYTRKINQKFWNKYGHNLGEQYESQKFDGKGQTLWAGSGNDYIDVSQKGRDNTINLGSGNDIAILGQKNRVIGAEGDDKIVVGYGKGGNIISTGVGEDEVWLFTNQKNIPDLKNTITDFNVNEDILFLSNKELNGHEKGLEWDLTQTGNNVLITAFGQEIAQLLDVQVSALNESNVII